MPLWLWLIVLLFASYRLTMLIVSDEITSPIREWLRSHGTKTMIGRNYSGDVTGTRIDPKPGIGRVWFALHRLTLCAHCTSMWTSVVVVALAFWQGSWFKYVCDVLALSALVSILSDRS